MTGAIVLLGGITIVAAFLTFLAERARRREQGAGRR